MPGMGTLATTQIITKGLACQQCTPTVPVPSACKPGIITAGFSLYCTTVATLQTGGGPYPGKAWNKFGPGEIKDFYQEVTPEQPYLVPRDQEAKYFEKKTHVVLRTSLNGTENEKEYAVPAHRTNANIQIPTLVNVTRDRATPIVSGLRRVATKAFTVVKNLYLRRSHK